MECVWYALGVHPSPSPAPQIVPHSPQVPKIVPKAMFIL